MGSLLCIAAPDHPSWSEFFHFHAVFSKKFAKKEIGAPLRGLSPLWEILDSSLYCYAGIFLIFVSSAHVYALQT